MPNVSARELNSLGVTPSLTPNTRTLRPKSPAREQAPKKQSSPIKPKSRPAPQPPTELPLPDDPVPTTEAEDLPSSDVEYSTPPVSPEPTSDAMPNLTQEQLDNILARLSQLETANTELRSQREQSVGSSNGGAGKKSSKISRPEKLIDGVEKIQFIDWKVGVTNVLNINADHFENEAAKMYLVFDLTEPTGLARAHLRPRYQTGEANDFTTHQEMLELLAESFVDPNEKRRAKTKYDAMTQNNNPDVKGAKYASFDAFKADYIITANAAKIDKSMWFEGIFEKSSVYLQEKVITILPLLDNDFKKLCNHMATTELELNRIQLAKSEKKHSTNAKSSYPRDRKAASSSSSSEKKPLPAIANRDTPKHFTGPQPEKDYSNYTCNNCGIKGHLATTCTKEKKIAAMDEQELSDMEDAEQSENSNA